jgi:diadenosine tetraphosphate (Ap4A) HIT family hydrolase
MTTANQYPHWEKFQPAIRTVHELEHWLIVVRAKQVTLGSCVLLLKRPVPSLAAMYPAEAAELAPAIEWYEARLRETFGAERFNYIIAMMKDPYLHLHALPRYSADVEFEGKIWTDKYWPAVATLADVETDDTDVTAIVTALRDS